MRAALIDAAARLIADQGLSRLTVDAVARLAGVTKGGLFHHFPTKADLVQGVLDEMIDHANTTIEELMATDPDPQGRFTRAYLKGVLTSDKLDGETSSRTLCLAMLGDPELQESWAAWVAGRIAAHADTDDSVGCALVRLATDGIWLNSLRDPTTPTSVDPALLDTMLALTRASP